MLVLIVVLYALCASMFTIAKAVLAYCQPIFFIAIRMFLAGVLLLGYDLWQRRKIPVVSWRNDAWLLAQLVLFHIYFVYVPDLWSLQYLMSSRSALWFSLTPFFSAGFAYALSLETMSWKKIAGLLIGFTGMLIDTVPQLAQGGAVGLSLPDMVVIVSVASGAYGWIVFKMLLDTNRYSTFFLNGVAMIVGGLLSLATSAVFEFPCGPVVTDWYEFMKLTIAIIFLGNIIYYTLYGYLLRMYTNTFLSFAGFLCPFFAGILGFMFLAEQLSWTFFVSLLFVCVGLYVFHHEEL